MCLKEKGKGPVASPLDSGRGISVGGDTCVLIGVNHKGPIINVMHILFVEQAISSYMSLHQSFSSL